MGSPFCLVFFFFVCASLYLISFLSVCVFFSWQLNKTKQKCVCANQDRRGELRHIQQIGFFKNFELFSPLLTSVSCLCVGSDATHNMLVSLYIF